MTSTGVGSIRPEPARWWARERLVDAVLAAVLAAIALSSVLTDDPAVTYEFRDPDARLVVLALLGSLPLAMRRRWPLLVHTVMLAALVTVGLLGFNTGLVTACLMFSLYTVAAWCRLRVAMTGLVLLYAGLAVLGLAGTPYFADWLGWLATTGFVVAWLLGRLVRQWRSEREQAVARALAAERARAVAAERAVFAERLRIARELHDIVAHTLSVIAVQSGTARHQLATDPAQAGGALGAIEQASRAALADLRRMLGVLRSGPDGAGPPGLAPSPGVAELELLVSTHRAAYGPVELTVDPAVAGTPESLRATVYRLVQEALTNVRRHAAGAAARVSVTADRGTVVVQVDDDGSGQPGTAPPAEGFGLAGMRERVALFGGSLAAGPLPAGGFRVRAVLRTADQEVAA